MENNHFNVAWAKSTALYTKAASVLGIGYPEMMVLYALESMGELTQKQIAENFGMQKQTVHTVVSALQKKGYLLLEASEGDKREKRMVVDLADAACAGLPDLAHVRRKVNDGGHIRLRAQNSARLLGN